MNNNIKWKSLRFSFQMENFSILAIFCRTHERPNQAYVCTHICFCCTTLCRSQSRKRRRCAAGHPRHASHSICFEIEREEKNFFFPDRKTCAKLIFNWFEFIRLFAPIRYKISALPETRREFYLAIYLTSIETVSVLYIRDILEWFICRTKSSLFCREFRKFVLFSSCFRLYSVPENM